MTEKSVQQEIQIPEVDLASIINVEEIQSIMDDFCHLTSMTTAILDLKGKVIEATGWQDMCTKFHRVHPETSCNCTESDLYLSKHLKPGEYVDYKCKNGLWDVVTPLFVGDKHLGNIYTGQFFYDDEQIDETLFINQAEKYGFDQEAYLDAFRRIPRYSRKTIQQLMRFLAKFTAYISRIGLVNLHLEQEKCERKLTEKALIDSESLLNEVGRIAKIGGWEMDLISREAKWTKGAYEIVGIEYGQPPPGPDEHLSYYLPEYRDMISEKMAGLIERDLPLDFEARLWTLKGEIKWCRAIGQGIWNQGRCIRVYGTLQDITDRKKAEEEIRNLNRDLELRVRQRTAQLEEASKELEDFVYSVSHDLRAPLRSISGFAEIIDRRHKQSLNEEGAHYFSNIIKASRQMGLLIDDLLKFSRMGRKAIKCENISLDEVLKAAVETVSDLAKKTSARIHIPEQMPLIHGDFTLTTHIFINLLENAMKYHKPDEPPCVEVGIEAEDPYVVVSVMDNGIGIAPEYHEKIFKIFQRLHNQEDYPGTGIGLAAAKKALQITGGKIGVESQPGEGSVFKVKLLAAIKA
ncbi:MAG: PocR ligand-binding domain-containing protein [Proteobacteria bacterium]|nr:PocR ligand-binding domain-containing protein [Pseudomonadota bacterium]MBU4469796.1 PocR ligand-binding domain-containing protein [Pseudomonadota bacterium]MCG2753031.1 PocR ligand-binding domain-containing protein [Desulfobacteraceae bacterium]